MNPVIGTSTSFAPPAVSRGGSMATEAAAMPAALSTGLDVALPAGSASVGTCEDSLFDHLAWVYIFFRERIFRDDTERIAGALWPDLCPEPGERLMELGCGPGLYSCGLAARFPEVSVLGVDRSPRQLDWARTKAHKQQLANCRSERDNVLRLTHGDESFDGVIAARLFTVLPDQERAIAEMYRVLRPGGRCVIAEPRYAFWASLPLLAMRLIARVTRMKTDCREPGKAVVLSPGEFENLFATQPWRSVETWQDGRYQYARCEKD
jgi:SAM-dependent methyltransferase